MAKLKVWKVHVLRLKTWKCLSSSSACTCSKAYSSESTGSSINCVIVSDTDVSVHARKKTELSTKSTRTNCIEQLNAYITLK